MKRLTFFPIFLLVLLTACFANATQKAQTITMEVPASVIKEALVKSLPMQFPINSNTIVGSISIDKIRNLQILQNKLSGHATLTGHNLQIVTSIAGHDIRMKAGSLTTSFRCDAAIRFDARTQTLYLKPQVTNLQSTNQQMTDLASAIAPLFNNREFPLQMETLQPILADTGNKLLSISMNIADISLRPGKIVLSITPKIDARNKSKR